MMNKEEMRIVHIHLNGLQLLTGLAVAFGPKRPSGLSGSSLNSIVHGVQPSATSPPFFDNLHFEDFDKSLCSPNEDFGRRNKR